MLSYIRAHNVLRMALLDIPDLRTQSTAATHSNGSTSSHAAREQRQRRGALRLQQSTTSTGQAVQNSSGIVLFRLRPLRPQQQRGLPLDR